MTRFRQFAAGATVGFAAILSGCADRTPAVPASANLMTEGSNQISFRANEFGRVYISDETDHRILYQGDVDKGDMVELNAKDDRILVAGRTVSERPMEDTHDYKIFFEPTSKERTVRYRVVEEPAR
jgi:hypothetical protein